MPGWIKSNALYTFRDYSGPIVLFAGDGTDPTHPLHRAPRQWHTMDLRGEPFNIPEDATFATLSAHMIITDLTAGIDNLTCTVRPVGSGLAEGNYQFQAVSVFSGNGARGRQGSVNVALTGGKFELWWQATVNGSPEDLTPTGSSFLINMTVDAWGRYEIPPAVAPAGPSIAIPPGGATYTFVPSA